MNKKKKREAIIGTVQRAFPVLLSGRQPLYKASGVVPIHSKAEFGLKCCPTKQHRHLPMNWEMWWYGESANETSEACSARPSPLIPHVTIFLSIQILSFRCTEPGPAFPWSANRFCQKSCRQHRPTCR